MQPETKAKRASAPRPTRSRVTAYQCIKGHTMLKSAARGLYCEVCDK